MGQIPSLEQTKDIGVGAHRVPPFGHRFQETAIMGGDQVGREPHTRKDLMIPAGLQPFVGSVRPVLPMPGPVAARFVKPESIHHIIIDLHAALPHPENLVHFLQPGVLRPHHHTGVFSKGAPFFVHKPRPGGPRRPRAGGPPNTLPRLVGSTRCSSQPIRRPVAQPLNQRMGSQSESSSVLNKTSSFHKNRLNHLCQKLAPIPRKGAFCPLKSLAPASIPKELCRSTPCSRSGECKALRYLSKAGNSLIAVTPLWPGLLNTWSRYNPATVSLAPTLTNP